MHEWSGKILRVGESKPDARNSSARMKGRLVEAIVAAMHQTPDVEVRQNVRMPVIGDAKRTSEIDVLLNGAVAGYPVQIAFECKNEESVVGTPKINAFIGKLGDVGIPTQQGIFVAASGFTRGAVARAQKAGIRTLVLTGLTSNRIAAAVEEAFQAAIHLWLVVTEVSIINNVSPNDTPEQLGVFYDENGQVVGSIMDLVWRKWYAGEIPDIAGEHPVVLQLPLGWRHMIRGAESIPDQMYAKVQVYAFVTILPGKANRHALLDATTGKISKLRVTGTFDSSQATVQVFQTEEALQQYFARSQAGVRLNTRSRLPRIQWRGTLWPPSVKLIEALNTAFANGTDPKSLKLEELDGPTLEGMWDRVWHSPMLDGILRARFK
jgi:hypothetical protein